MDFFITFTTKRAYPNTLQRSEVHRLDSCSGVGPTQFVSRAEFNDQKLTGSSRNNYQRMVSTNVSKEDSNVSFVCNGSCFSCESCCSQCGSVDSCCYKAREIAYDKNDHCESNELFDIMIKLEQALKNISIISDVMMLDPEISKDENKLKAINEMILKIRLSTLKSFKPKVQRNRRVDIYEKIFLPSHVKNEISVDKSKAEDKPIPYRYLSAEEKFERLKTTRNAMKMAFLMKQNAKFNYDFNKNNVTTYNSVTT